VDAVATQPLAEMHVVRHEMDVTEADPAQRIRDVDCDGLVAFPRSRVSRRVHDATWRQLVAAEYDGQAQPRHKVLDLRLEPAYVGRAILFGSPLRARRKIRSRVHAPHGLACFFNFWGMRLTAKG
jgi:hypothetical protein